MNIKDIITLAKAGYTSSDIKELLNAPEPVEPIQPAKTENEQPETDYRKLYEDSQAKLNEVKESLEKVQQLNNSKDSSTIEDNLDPIDKVMNLFR